MVTCQVPTSSRRVWATTVDARQALALGSPSTQWRSRRENVAFYSFGEDLMQATKRLMLLVCALALFAVPATANATITTKTIDYGPYTIPAGNGDPHDHENAGMITNKIVSNIAKPCTGCTIIGITPDLVYTDGTKATISQGPM